MPETHLLTAGLAFLMPLGYALIAMGGLQSDRARRAVLGVVAALGLGSLGYFASGFALQFGGVGLANSLPGLDGLVWEWSALGATWGSGWGMAGLVGWGLTGPAATPTALALALANLPWVTTATMIPLLSLRGRIPAWASGLLGLAVGAVIYPLAGNWIWGGGWLANLGANLGYGHGVVDIGGAGLVHLLGAAVTLAGVLVFTDRGPAPSAKPAAVELPPVHLPLLAALGAGLLLVGGFAWSSANPILDVNSLSMPRLALNTVLAASAGALLPLLYSWFIAGHTDPLMAIRGFAGGTVAITAAAPFVPPWAALAVGACAGLLVLLAIFVVDHVLRWEDPTAALSVHGVAGALGLLSVGIFADGLYGRGWNGGPVTDLSRGVGQGVTGLMSGSGLPPDWPGQAQAQMVGALSLALFAFMLAWLLISPITLIGRLARRQNGQTPQVAHLSQTARPLASTSVDPMAPGQWEPSPAVAAVAPAPIDETPESSVSEAGRESTSRVMSQLPADQ